MKWVIVPVLGLVLASFYGGQAIAPSHVQTKTFTKTVTKTVTLPAKTVTPTIYHIGDTQGGVTLIGEYHDSYTDTMGASPRTVELVVFALSTPIKQAVILLSDGTYMTPDSPKTTFPDIPACSQYCVAFTNPGLVIKSFLYNGLEWSL